MKQRQNFIHIIQKQFIFFIPLIFTYLISLFLIFIRRPESWFDWDNFGSTLFLAWLPLLFALLSDLHLTCGKSIFLRYFLYLLWFLFFPNSPYLFTEMVHLVEAYGNCYWDLMFWFDLVIFYSYIWNGFIAGLFSLWIIHHHLNRRFSPIIAWILINLYLILAGLAIFLGRFMRWNSWEFFTQPYELYDSFIGHLKYGGFLPFLSIITFLFYTICIIAYIFFLGYVDKNYFRNRGESVL